MKGLIASLLRIRPVITVDLESGKYASLAQERTMKKAVEKMVELAQKTYAAGSDLRVQLMHGANPEMLVFMKETLDNAFHCHWLPSVSVAPVLGAHTGPSVVAFSVAPVELFEI
jgi:fatty acid-binding protein DegV